jgi:cell division FtsZ-interacting protein ZapD
MPGTYPPYSPATGIGSTTHIHIPGVSQEEFNKLKAELEELKKLLIAAKIFDEKTGQPHCEAEDKVALLKRVADALGVDIKDAL